MNNITFEDLVENNNTLNSDDYFKFSNIENIINNVFENSRLPEKLKMKNSNILHTNQPANEYITYSFLFFNQLIFKVTFRKKASSFIEFSSTYKAFCKDAISREDSKFLKYNMDMPGFINRFNKIMQNILMSELNKVHGDAFGCCSKYEECSNNKGCVHDDIEFYLSCQYRLNLINGHIFYGKNKTENGFYKEI